MQESFSELMESYLAVPAPGNGLPEERQCRRAGTADRLRDYPSPQEELDLHRCTAPEAERKIENLIHTARGLGLLTLRIITGKGLHSEGPAVLPELTESKLAELKGRGLVLAYRWEGKKREKSGAIIVYLQRF